MLASPLFLWQKISCTSESSSPAVCTFNSRASCDFFVTAVMSMFSESNAHCEVAEVLTMPKKQSLDWSIFYVQALVNQLFFDSKSARVARGLGQGNSIVDWVDASVHAGMATVLVEVNAGAGGGGGPCDMWAPFWRCRSTFPALLMTPSYHSLEN